MEVIFLNLLGLIISVRRPSELIHTSHPLEDSREIGIPPTIFYKDGATQYVIQHEFYLVEEFTFLGKDEYLAGAFGTPKEKIINDVLREKYVYKRILENANDFNLAELEHAKGYYLEQLQKLLKRKLEIKPEYVVKPIKK